MATSMMNRRSFISQSGGIAAAISASVAPAAISQNSKQPPNVLFVICDQMRGDAMSCLGHPNARTPNIDRLAREGMLFENAYCNNPVCVPSRMSIFSGLYPHQTGRLSNRSWNGRLLEFDNTLAHHFAERGYQLGWIGKNHTYRNSAWDQFDTVSIRAREPFRKYSRFVPPHWHSDTLLPESMCHPRLNTDEAIDFIQRQKSSQPFFLHVSYFDPHPPYMAPAEFTSRYCSTEMELPDYIPASNLSDRLDTFWRGFHMDQVTDSDLTETLRYYYASIEWGVDFQLGRLMNALNQSGLRENTIVVFTSDHGDFMAHYRLVRKGMFLYDALLHVPLIISAPGIVPQHERNTNQVQLLDLFPTLAELSGGSIPDHCEGLSLKPVLQGEELDRDYLFTSAAYGDVDPNVTHPGIDLSDDDETPIHTRIMEQSMEPTHKTKMIRNHGWKLILNESEEPELYMMDGGHLERKNIFHEVSDSSKREMVKHLEQWWEW